MKMKKIFFRGKKIYIVEFVMVYIVDEFYWFFDEKKKENVKKGFVLKV